jgi:hypothetical protein
MDQWQKDSEKREICSNSMFTFRSFSCFKISIKVNEITIVVHELYLYPCNLYSNLFSLKSIR